MSKRIAWIIIGLSTALVTVHAIDGRVAQAQNAGPQSPTDEPAPAPTTAPPTAPEADASPAWLTVQEPRFLYVLLKLRKDTQQADRRIVESLGDLRWFTHVILVTPSWQEKPDATLHPLVRQALDTCRRRDIPVVWGRWLWVAWRPKQAKTPPTVGAEYDPKHYVQAISRVKREAAVVGAVGTFLDCEPYGKCPQMASLKRKKLNSDDRRRIQQAIASAVATAGPVDLVYPTSSSDSPWHFAWPMARLGILRCDAKSYYARPPDYKLPRIVPPAGFTHRIDLWGSAVGLGRPQDIYNGNKTLTSSEVVALDLTKIRQRFPTCRGFWVWVDYNILPEVIRSWPK